MAENESHILDRLRSNQLPHWTSGPSTSRTRYRAGSRDGWVARKPGPV